MDPNKNLIDIINSTPFVDTHEHLLEESTRLNPPEGDPIARCSQKDFSILFSHYACDDLKVAGISEEQLNRLFDPSVDPSDKWEAVWPYYQKSRHTGYMQAARESLRILFDEEDFSKENVQIISERVRARIKPGFYENILKKDALIENAHVNSVETPVFMESKTPELLAQDMSFVALSTNPQISEVARLVDSNVSNLADWHKVIDLCFEKYAPKAVALKNQCAYSRRLNFEKVTKEEASPLFERFLKGRENLGPEEHKALQDHLFHYCLKKAREYRLPVKLHTGYHVGWGVMPLHKVRKNAADLSTLLMDYPDVNFVIMHITWPYQHESIALAKHFSNAWVDMCWAWILNPVACTRFVREFLSAAPQNKLLTFGGDYLPVELVPGHASVARKGLARALTQMLSAGFLKENKVEGLVEDLMRKNAHSLFNQQNF